MPPSAARPWATCCTAAPRARRTSSPSSAATSRWTYARVRRAVQPPGRRPGRAAASAKGDRVAVLARNSHAFAALRFALARLGAVLVPINFMLKADEVAYILRHAGATHAGHRQRPGRAGARRGGAGHRGDATSSGCRPRTPATLPEPACSPSTRWPPATARAARAGAATASDLLQIVYTSGTESLPKGAMLTHDAVIVAVRQLRRRRRDRRRRPGAARAAAVPLRAARRVPGPGDLLSAPATSSPPSRRRRTCCR